MRSIPFAIAILCALTTGVVATHSFGEEAKEVAPNEVSQLPLRGQVLALRGKGLPPDPAADDALKLLDRKADLVYPGIPICEVIADLRDRYGTAMYLDEHALAAAKISSRAPFDFQKVGTPLFIGLQDMARTQDLTCQYRYHAIWLTTPKAAMGWQDPSGTLSLKPEKGSPLEKALGQPANFDFLFSPMAVLPSALKTHHGVTADVSDIVAPIEQRIDRPKANLFEKSLPLRDALGILFTLQNCRCHAKDGVLVIEPIKPLP